jgi:LPXTG-motif cell wall-anchored protein
MQTSWLLLAIGAIALAIGFLLRARRRRNENQVLKADIRKWEEEGGNVPQVPTVSPVVTPRTSEPAGR